MRPLKRSVLAFAVALWVYGCVSPCPPVDPKFETISNLDDCVYRVHWWNTQTGRIDVRQTGTSRNGRLQLDVPPLTGDAAVQVTP